MANISKLKDGDEPHARKTKILRDKFSYIIELQKPENNNAKTGAPNFYKVSKQTGIDRVQLMKWWKKKTKFWLQKESNTGVGCQQKLIKQRTKKWKAN